MIAPVSDVSAPTLKPELEIKQAVLKPAGQPAAADRGLQQLVLGLFIGSGAAGLIYQVVWSRELVLLFGNAATAKQAVLITLDRS